MDKKVLEQVKNLIELRKKLQGLKEVQRNLEAQIKTLQTEYEEINYQITATGEQGLAIVKELVWSEK